jgi:hypothetical protein
VLQTRELDGEAIFEMSHYAALHLAEDYESADRRALIGGDAGARLRHIDDAAGEVDAARHEQAPDRVTWDDTAVTAVFRQPEDVRLASQVSCAASLSRLRGVAEMLTAKPF